MAAPTPRLSGDLHSLEDVGFSLQSERGSGAPTWLALTQVPFLQATLGLRAPHPPDSFYFNAGPGQCTLKERGVAAERASPISLCL